MHSMIALSMREKITTASAIANRRRTGKSSDQASSGFAIRDGGRAFGGVCFGPFFFFAIMPCRINAMRAVLAVHIQMMAKGLVLRYS
ncbi:MULTISPECIES: hypothetical protein [unclassified Bradyrhizobium]|uniref:hypothetical protein n=1 Tax=unclassified Bradyrhizobium TaxID=2631580 RepID=UPI002915DC5A|nr:MULTISPECIES: hypothetical protein [unclassified Bradyrhizobium]